MSDQPPIFPPFNTETSVPQSPPVFNPNPNLQRSQEPAKPFPLPPQPVSNFEKPVNQNVSQPSSNLTKNNINNNVTALEIRKKIDQLNIKDTFDSRLITTLIQKNKIDFLQLDSFIAQASNSGSITDYVLGSNIANEQDLVQVSAEIHNMPYVDLNEEHIEEGLIELLSPEQAQEWGVIPYGRNDLGHLLIAIANPSNLKARDQISKVLYHEKKIAWRLAAPSSLRIAVDRYYASAASLVSGDTSDNFEEASLETLHGDHDSAIVRLVNEIIIKANLDRASDIHIEPKEKETLVRYRVDGILHTVMRIPKRDTAKVISRIKTLTGRMRTDWRNVPQDGRIRHKTETGYLDLRVVSVPAQFGEEIVMRLLDPKQANLPLEELGMSKNNLERYLKGINKAHGCALITGPTGSGKSTTLYSSLKRIWTPEVKIFTIEDPVEYELSDISQIDVSGHGEQSMTFLSALRSILRADPDIVMVGEIRDAETAKISMEAALTGHYLFSTMHTNDAIEAISRLTRLEIEPFLIATGIECLVAQRLLRKLCSTCRISFKADYQMLQNMKAPLWALERAKHEPLNLWRAREGGCIACKEAGYRGRIGIHEVVLINEEISEAILQGKDTNYIKKIARSHGMGSLRDDAFEKVFAGLTSMEEMARVIATRD